MLLLDALLYGGTGDDAEFRDGSISRMPEAAPLSLSIMLIAAKS